MQKKKEKKTKERKKNKQKTKQNKTNVCMDLQMNRRVKGQTDKWIDGRTLSV